MSFLYYGGGLCWYVAVLAVVGPRLMFLNAVRYNPQGHGDENCETLKSEIHLSKEEFDQLGRLQRTCNADVDVNKCEGLCNSQVQPSVITPTGFLKVRSIHSFVSLVVS